MDGFHFINTSHTGAGSSSFQINAESGGTEGHDYRYADLQAQWMDVVMENEKLAAELEHVKYDEVKSLSSELQAEEERVRELEEQLRANKPYAQQRRRKLTQSRKEILYKTRSMVNLSGDANSEDDADIISTLPHQLEPEVAEDALINQDGMLRSGSAFQLSQLSPRLKIWLSNKYKELADDFSEVKMNVEVPDKEGEQLNPFKLQRNLIRLENFLQPFEENVHSLGSITRWENPVVSFMAFTIYMVIIYKDWLLPAIFLTIVSVFTFTYLRHKGRSFGDEIENIANYKEETAKDLSMRDQISILINVSRRSQGHAGLGSDILEKIRNVLLWREPELTKPVVLVCGMVFVCSLLFPFSFLVRTSGLGLGIHIFIIQYVFSRYPRLNRKYNKVEELISQLKTDAEYEMEIKKIKKNLKKSPKIARSESAIQSTSSLNTTSAMSSSSLNSLDCSEITTLASFHDTFQLPTSEIPLPTWKNGRRCILVNKEKYFAVGFKTGKMYVTNNYLLFERHKTVSSKNVVIHMETIKTITKAKLHQWVPGGGKAIEVKVKDSSKTLVFVFQVNIFGPIVNRDEAFDSIMEVGVTNDYLWAKTKESTQ